MKILPFIVLPVLTCTALADNYIVGGNTPHLPPEVAAAAVSEHVLYAAPAGRLQVMSVNEEQKVIDTVPGSTWRAGCVPTAVGILLMYWDMMGYEDLMDQAGNDYSFRNPRNLELMANQGHYNDYFYPDDSATANVLADKSIMPDGTEHYDTSRKPTCIADALLSSFASKRNRSGVTNLWHLWTPEAYNAMNLAKWVRVQNPTYSAHFRVWQSWIAASGTGEFHYLQYDDMDKVTLGPEGRQIDADPATSQYYKNRTIGDESWDMIVEEINANRPLLASVNAYAKEGRDHVVVVVGYRYNKATGEKFYAAKNTWEHETRWYKFRSSWDGTGEKMGLSDVIAIEIRSSAEVSPAAFSPQMLYSFRNKNTGAWFFSANSNEVHYVWENIPVWEYQGPRFPVETAPSADNAPVYRFYNANAAAHFYTISEAERDAVIANLSHVYTYEGVAFYGKTWRGADEDPVYRFYLPRTGSHFFTNSYTEMQYLVAYGDPSYIKFEGVAWYAKPVYDVWRERAPF